MPKNPEPSPPGSMEEDESDIEETSGDDEAFSEDETEDEEEPEVDLNTFLRQMSKQMESKS